MSIRLAASTHDTLGLGWDAQVMAITLTQPDMPVGEAMDTVAASLGLPGSSHVNLCNGDFVAAAAAGDHNATMALSAGLQV